MSELAVAIKVVEGLRISNIGLLVADSFVDDVAAAGLNAEQREAGYNTPQGSLLEW